MLVENWFACLQIAYEKDTNGLTVRTRELILNAFISIDGFHVVNFAQTRVSKFSHKSLDSASFLIYSKCTFVEMAWFSPQVSLQSQKNIIYYGRIWWERNRKCQSQWMRITWYDNTHTQKDDKSERGIHRKGCCLLRQSCWESESELLERESHCFTHDLVARFKKLTNWV